MSGVAIFAVLLAALVSPSQENAIGNATCELQFQEHINAAIAVKRECESAALTDCCQVRSNEQAWLFAAIVLHTYVCIYIYICKIVSYLHLNNNYSLLMIAKSFNW